MRLSILTLSVLAASLSFGRSVATAEETHAEAPHVELQSAEKKVVRLTEKGLEPASLVLKNLDSSVFFVNETQDSPLSVSVDFGNRRMHCATGNVKLVDGKLRSVEPVGPRDFVLMCFPEKGVYRVEVQGIRGARETASGTVTVE